MTQKRRKADSGKAIRETTALRWEPTHVTKPNPRVVPLHIMLWFGSHTGNTRLTELLYVVADVWLGIVSWYESQCLILA